MRKIFIVLAFRIYGLFETRINRFYKEITDCNDNFKIIPLIKVSKYLLHHKLPANINELPLTDKATITAKVSTINPAIISSYIYTGGSYGDPFKLPYSKKREMIRTASFRYFNEIAGYRLGDPYLLIAAKPRPFWSQFLRNEYRFLPRNLNQNKIASVVKLICREKIPVIIGFSSVIADLAAYIDKYKIKHHVRAIIFTSEPVDETKAEFIKKVFNCEVTDRYSNEEVGLIAQQRTFGGVYYTNRYNVLVEILDDQLKPVKTGEMGHVVVTDLEADLVPVVRYDTGDLAVACEYKDGQLISMKSIAGRTAERIFGPDGQPIASLALGPLIHKPMTEANYYNQFQFAQIGQRNYELRLKNGDILPGNVLQQIIDNLHLIFGTDAKINVRFVTDIPPLKSGKRPIYVNEWLNIKTVSDV